MQFAPNLIKFVSCLHDPRTLSYCRGQAQFGTERYYFRRIIHSSNILKRIIFSYKCLDYKPNGLHLPCFPCHGRTDTGSKLQLQHICLQYSPDVAIALYNQTNFLYYRVPLTFVTSQAARTRALLYNRRACYQTPWRVFIPDSYPVLCPPSLTARRKLVN